MWIMAARKSRSLSARINRVTGVSSNVNGARGVYRVNAGKSERGTSTTFGNRDAKRRDIRVALGLNGG